MYVVHMLDLEWRPLSAILHMINSPHHYCHTQRVSRMFFFNIHYLLSCPRYMHLNLPETVHSSFSFFFSFSSLIAVDESL